MVSLQPYDDVPAIEYGDGSFMIDPFATMYHPEELTHYSRSVDARLSPPRSVAGHEFDSSSHLISMGRHVHNLAKCADGFPQAPPLKIPGPAFPRLGLIFPWTSAKQYRPQRYLSPSNLSGRSRSFTESPPSECAFSPNATRCGAKLITGPCDTYSMPSFAVPCSTEYGNWTPQPMYVHHLVESPPCSQAPACSMRDLQYTPDPVAGEDANVDCIRVDAHHPDELPLSPENEFTDEGIGRSVSDDLSKENGGEEDDQDNEVDLSYYPKHSKDRLPPSSRRPSLRSRRRTQTVETSKKSVIGQEYKVTKPSQRNNSTAKLSKSAKSPRLQRRTFTCSFARYGCPSTFGSKNEWKRHVTSQHLQLGFYRCDAGVCNSDLSKSGKRSYNDFNRKDLFTQHHRRMHTPWSPASREPSARAKEEFEKRLETIRQRCWLDRRKAPERSSCGFCGRVFEGENGWDERMEHVGKHFEKRDTAAESEELEDEDLRDWALREGILEDRGGRGVWLAGVAPGNATMRKGTRRQSEEEQQQQQQENGVVGGVDEQ